MPIDRPNVDENSGGGRHRFADCSWTKETRFGLTKKEGRIKGMELSPVTPGTTSTRSNVEQCLQLAFTHEYDTWRLSKAGNNDKASFLVDDKKGFFHTASLPNNDNHSSSQSVGSSLVAEAPPRKRYRMHTTTSNSPELLGPVSSLPFPTSANPHTNLAATQSQPPDVKIPCRVFCRQARVEAGESAKESGVFKGKTSTVLRTVEEETGASPSTVKHEVAIQESDSIKIDLEQLTYYPPEPSNYDSVYGYKTPTPDQQASPSTQTSMDDPVPIYVQNMACGNVSSDMHLSSLPECLIRPTTGRRRKGLRYRIVEDDDDEL